MYPNFRRRHGKGASHGNPMTVLNGVLLVRLHWVSLFVILCGILVASDKPPQHATTPDDLRNPELLIRILRINKGDAGRFKDRQGAAIQLTAQAKRVVNNLLHNRRNIQSGKTTPFWESGYLLAHPTVTGDAGTSRTTAWHASASVSGKSSAAVVAMHDQVATMTELSRDCDDSIVEQTLSICLAHLARNGWDHVYFPESKTTIRIKHPTLVGKKAGTARSVTSVEIEECFTRGDVAFALIHWIAAPVCGEVVLFRYTRGEKAEWKVDGIWVLEAH